MARTDNLPNFLTDVADAIKSKTGDNTSIPASQFDIEIDKIKTGADAFHSTSNVYNAGSSLTAVSRRRSLIYLLLTKIPYTELDLTNLTSLASALRYSLVDYVDVSGWDVSTITYFNSVFSVTLISNLDLSMWQPPLGVDTTTYYLSSIISSCHSLITADLSCFEGVWDIGNLAAGCTSLEHLDIRGLDLTNCANQSTFLGDATADTPTNVPYDCEIIVANQTQKDYMTTNFSDYINVKTIAEYEAE